MKRLILVALMVLVTMVGMVEVSSVAAQPAAPGQSIIQQLQLIQQSLNSLQTDINTLKADVNSLQTDVNSLQKEPPRWSQKLQCDATACPRFIVLSSWNSEAVLDRETGLVWEGSPSTSSYNWSYAQSHCNNLGTGGRLGWRLPTVQELASLVDPNAPSSPFLPVGHPFQNVQSSDYWSATTDANPANGAWRLNLSNGIVIPGGKSSNVFVWCVRGGQGVDPQ